MTRNFTRIHRPRDRTARHRDLAPAQAQHLTHDPTWHLLAEIALSRRTLLTVAGSVGVAAAAAVGAVAVAVDGPPSTAPAADAAGTGAASATNGLNVHSIALQVPINDLIRPGSGIPKVTDARAVIGVWTSASRRQVRLARTEPGERTWTGPHVQVSRLGNPLFNEVIVPMAKKDLWNELQPAEDKRFASYVTNPELGNLLPALFPGVFPNLAALNASQKPRADLAAILLTGIPAGLIPGFQNNTGPVEADMLRLNTAIPPSSAPSIYGLLGGDLAGFPNGRRVQDDVVAIELRAVAGVTYALVDKTFTPDAAAGAVTDGLTPASVKAPYLTAFPYLGLPYDGFHNPS